jgi:hypothetical protein
LPLLGICKKFACSIAVSVSKEIIHPDQMCDMPDTLSVIPMLIPDPAFVKRKKFLAWDIGNDH